MSIHMNVYLNNEDDAESLAASLQKYDIENERVEKISDYSDDNLTIIPAAGMAGNAGSAHQGSPAMFGSLSKLKETMTKDEKKYPEYMLTFEVDEKNKQAVLDEIQKTDGFIEKDVMD
ncbi:hypothetical protein [Alkalicoccus daliensis]|uniref:General stress protein 17M-like domain-containing protein n=1 Tax=Alkalicoccus daliensis TaxID=745820 RepID=A0A1H0GUT9_9BACI|nr:hypothetical protein [Alkalicoccus daliensis]SDO10628.1 hypothetical protein SAMN04488053_10742 [Alkalicoccus daliensis]